MEALVAMGERGKTLLPDLQETFDECPLLHSHFRCEAAFAAARLDPANEPAVRFLEWASRHADRMIWERAKKKLDRLQKAVRVDSDER